MGFFSELDMWYRNRGKVVKNTPKYADYILKYYKTRRKNDETTRNKDNK